MASRAYRIVKTHDIDIPDPKDREHWLAGGELRNASLAGGGSFDPTINAAIYNKPRNGGTLPAMLNGQTLQMLNTGYANVLGALNNNILDVLNDFTLRQTIVFAYTIFMREDSIGYSDSKTSIIITSEGNDDNDGWNGGNLNGLTGTTSLDDIQAAFNNRVNLQGLLANPNPIEIGFTAMNLLTGKSTTVSQKVQGAVIGTVQAGFTNVVTGMVAKALNVTSIPGAIGVNVLVAETLGELLEMAVGLDRSFGYGGEYLGTVNGKTTFTAPKSFVQGFTDSVKGLFGIETSVGVTDADGNYLGEMNAAYAQQQGMLTGSFKQLEKNLELDIVDYSTIDGGDYDTGSWGDSDTTGLSGGGGWGGSEGAGGGSDGSDGLDNDTANSSFGGFGEAQQQADNPDGFADADNSSNDNDNGDGGRYCCTVMVKHGYWKRRKLIKLGIWDSKQSKVWRVGYPIGGKWVAKVFDREWLLPWYSKMMDGFYRSAIEGQKADIWTWQARVIIYPVVYLAGTAKLVTQALHKLK